MAKIWIMRADDIIQRYSVSAKSLQSYGFSKATIPIQRADGIVQRYHVKLFKKLAEKMKKRVWNVKYKYEGKKGKASDIYSECVVTIVGKDPTEKDAKKVVEKFIEETRFDEDGVPYDLSEYIEVGLVSEEDTDDKEGVEFERIKYSHKG